jgi:hypothetical protein
VLVDGDAHAEMDVWNGGHGVPAGGDRGHRVPLAHGLSFRDGDRVQLLERDGIAVRRVDPHRPAASGDEAGEPDRPPDGGDHPGAEPAADVDAAVLPAGVRVLREREAAQDGAVAGPGPRLRRRGEHERGEGREQQPAHRRASSVVPLANEASTLAPPAAVVNSGYREPR